MPTREKNKKYWVIVASKDHLTRGIKEGFCQANHGKAAPLRRMRQGDWVLFYSSKEKYGEKNPYQKFTAIGQVKDDEVYQQQMSSDFTPYRRKVNFFPSREVAIKPLIDELSFIRNKKSWGYVFRFGFFEMPESDFKLIAHEMLKEPSVIHASI